jgi:hypothetical protein
MPKMNVMTLVDAVFAVASADDLAVICARTPFAWGTEAVIVNCTDDYNIPDEVHQEGFSYFLEKEDVLQLLEMISIKRASREAQAEFVAHYAVFDAYPRWFNDLPNR